MTDDDKPGAASADEQSNAGPVQFTDVNLDGRTDQHASTDGGDVEEPKARRRIWRGLFLLLFGLVVGVAGALLAPRYAQPYLDELPVQLSQDTMTEGRVTEKRVEDGRLVLRLSSEAGVALAIFTQNLDDIDLLIEQGDWVELRAGRYQPFLHDPAIDRVRPADASGTSGPAGSAPAPSADAEPDDAVAQPESEATDDARIDFEQQMSAELSDLEAEISAFKQAIATSGTTLTITARSYLEQIDRRAASARARLRQLRNASPAAWQDLRAGVEQAWDEVRTALTEARSHFEQDPPPQ